MSDSIDLKSGAYSPADFEPYCRNVQQYKVMTFRCQGASVRNVGERLGISKSYAHRIEQEVIARYLRDNATKITVDTQRQPVNHAEQKSLNQQLKTQLQEERRRRELIEKQLTDLQASKFKLPRASGSPSMRPSTFAF